ncbi:hypothetical protein OC844_000062 [Tilletia horrida]|nr:hypothetical protein OC844_000062 [Tilletia horrida]
MHPRSPYASSPPDFAALAQAYPDFARHVHRKEDGSSTIDFHDADAVRLKTLLLVDFKLVAEQAEDRLCPMVPNRLNYILWLQDIVAETKDVLALAQTRPSPAQPRLDPGTGASAIFPLLMCATDSSAQMVGTDIDAASLAHARSILAHPGNAPHRLLDRVQLILRKPDEPFFSSLKTGWLDTTAGDVIAFHFTMCNPPFFASRLELEDGARNKEHAPSAVCTGTEGEMVYSAPCGASSPGGEVGFVGRMIEESVQLHKAGRDAAWWYTTMLGRLSSVGVLLHQLKTIEKADSSGKSHGPQQGADSEVSWAVHELVQGQTKRWVLAWSFFGFQLSEPEGTAAVLARHRRPWLVRPGWIRSSDSTDATERHLQAILASISDTAVVVRGDAEGEKEAGQRHVFDVAVWSLSWTRVARRARERAEAGEGIDGTTQADSKQQRAILCVRLIVRKSIASGAHLSEVDLRWTFGQSRAAFDSFSQHIRNMWLASNAQR